MEQQQQGAKPPKPQHPQYLKAKDLTVEELTSMRLGEWLGLPSPPGGSRR